jgi:hypothetical protein
MRVAATASAGWGLTLVSVLGLASSMALRIYLDRAYLETPTLDALKSLLFLGKPGEPAMHASPLINLSYANTMLCWAALTGVVAVVGLVHACIPPDRRSQGQPRAIAVIVSLLTLYCLRHSWPLFEELAQR